MQRVLHRLNALSISRASSAGYLHDGGGLYLQISKSGSKSWIFRYSFCMRRREMGLGPLDDISLAKARETAASLRTSVRSGVDPIDARHAERTRQRLESARGVTFKDAMTSFLGLNEAGWRNKKHRTQWENTLNQYALPTIGKLPVAAIGRGEVARILEPIWTTKPETASRVRGRIEKILDWASARGYRTGENPARWRGHLENLLPSRRAVAKVRHHPALPIDDLPAVYERLRSANGTSALALRFVILTAARAGEVVGASWSEVDLDAKIWTVPADRTKTGRVHRVPLSKEALAVLAVAQKRIGTKLVFESIREGKALSLTALSKALDSAGGGDATTHGFRSTFRDWAAERTNFPPEVAEMALAHAIGNKVEAAYRRGELLTKRILLMERWATFATTPTRSAEVVSLAGEQRTRVGAR